MAYKVEVTRPFLTEHPITFVVERREEAKGVILTCLDLMEYSPNKIQMIIEKIKEEKEKESENDSSGSEEVL